nr:hypothetical protein [uncultured Fluviicola sp.]
MNTIKILLFLLGFVFTPIYGQQRSLAKLLGSGFHSIPARTNIPYMETNPACTLVPSVTLLGDTSGIVYQNEFMLFRNYTNPSHNSRGEIVSYLKNGFVSNAEYQEFQHWIRDSLAREHIYRGLKSDKEAIKYLKISRKELKDTTFYIDDRHGNREKFDLNWKIPFNYTDPQLMRFVAELYLPMHERFYTFRDFDEREFIYQYEEKTENETNSIDFRIPTISHESFWAKESVSINDEGSVLGQVYDKVLPEAPLIGITGMQANAFCHWKEIELQKQLNRKHLPYQVKVTLPLTGELSSLSTELKIEQRDYTQQWKITVGDYQLFMKAVRDSIVMEHLYNRLCEANNSAANQVIQYKANYFDESCGRYIKSDPYETIENRQNFPLTKDLRILERYPELVHAIILENEEVLRFYRYYMIDIKAKSMIGKLIGDPIYCQGFEKRELLIASETDSITRRLIGMDLNMDHINRLCQGSGVRDHVAYNRFIKREFVDITPGIAMESQRNEKCMKGITYELALAYYHWKYPIWSAKSGDDWQQFVYPNEEQFNRVQNAEQIIIPAHEINFPSPTFRYVVTFIPVND